MKFEDVLHWLDGVGGHVEDRDSHDFWFRRTAKRGRLCLLCGKCEIEGTKFVRRMPCCGAPFCKSCLEEHWDIQQLAGCTKFHCVWCDREPATAIREAEGWQDPVAHPPVPQGTPKSNLGWELLLERFGLFEECFPNLLDVPENMELLEFPLYITRWLRRYQPDYPHGTRNRRQLEASDSDEDLFYDSGMESD